VYTAFVSCSFAKKDQKLIDYLCKLIKAVKFEPHVARQATPEPVPEKIKDDIRSRDCFIAILTHDEKTADGKFKASDWIHEEIGIGYAFDKPIAVLLEEGIDLKSLPRYITQYITFDRNNLIDNTPDIVEFLENTKSKMENKIDENRIMSPNFTRNYFKAIYNIEKDGKSIFDKEIEIRSLIDGVGHFAHSISSHNISSEPLLKDCEFKFYSLTEADRIKTEITGRSDREIRWQGKIDPPLKSQEVIKYGFSYKIKNYFVMYIEKLHELIDKGTYYYEKPVAGDGIGIVVPTSYIYIEFNSPEKYYFTDAECDVFIGRIFKSSSRAQNEIQRIEQSGGFKEETFLNRKKLSLSLEHPQLGNSCYA